VETSCSPQGRSQEFVSEGTKEWFSSPAGSTHSSALEVIFYNNMRYINLRFTLLYFYLLYTGTELPVGSGAYPPKHEKYAEI